MKINEFIEKCKNVEKISNVIQFNKYIPLNQKRIFARDAIDKNMSEIDGFITIDNIGTDVSFAMNLIHEYTGLQVVDEIKDYDALCGSGLMTAILIEVEEDFNDARAILIEERNAVLAQNSIEAQVAKVTSSLVAAINSLSGKFVNAMDDFDIDKIIPEGANINELLDFARKYK